MYVMTKEHKLAISLSLKGKMPKFIPDNKGRKHTKQWINKWRKARMKSDGFKWGRHSEESKKKIARGNYKGNAIGYAHLHVWVNRLKSKTGTCEHCDENKKTDWANKSHKYLRVLNDWLELCRKCHIKYDKNNKGDATKKYGKTQLNAYRSK